jgi:Trypsin-like peptidase domain/TIR domain
MPATSIYKLLRDCTVRIDNKKVPQGTGFFVAPGLVLTCAHVLEKVTNEADLTIVWENQTLSAKIKTIINGEYPDLALLKIDNIAHECIYFQNDDAQPYDRLYSYGYPDHYPLGDPATPECEGITGGSEPLLRLKNTQIRPGMSGAPVLSQRTQRVCGIMQITRGRDNDLGGRALPSSMIFTTFPELIPLQEQYKQQQSIWTQSTKAVSLYYVYAKQDKELQNELSAHLRLLRYQNLISDWDADEIELGETMANTINEHLNTAEIILLLISTSFITADYCFGEAMKRAMQRREEGNATVIPILLRPCDWRSAPFGTIQPLPRDGQAITLARNRDLVLSDIARELRGLIEKRTSGTVKR